MRPSESFSQCVTGLPLEFLDLFHLSLLLSVFLATVRWFCGGVCFVVSLWEENLCTFKGKLEFSDIWKKIQNMCLIIKTNSQQSQTKSNVHWRELQLTAFDVTSFQGNEGRLRLVQPSKALVPFHRPGQPCLTDSSSWASKPWHWRQHTISLKTESMKRCHLFFFFYKIRKIKEVCQTVISESQWAVTNVFSLLGFVDVIPNSSCHALWGWCSWGGERHRLWCVLLPSL